MLDMMQALLKLRNELHSLEQAQELRMRKREALKKSIEEARQRRSAAKASTISCWRLKLPMVISRSWWIKP